MNDITAPARTIIYSCDEHGDTERPVAFTDTAERDAMRDAMLAQFGARLLDERDGVYRVAMPNGVERFFTFETSAEFIERRRAQEAQAAEQERRAEEEERAQVRVHLDRIDQFAREVVAWHHEVRALLAEPAGARTEERIHSTLNAIAGNAALMQTDARQAAATYTGRLLVREQATKY